MNMVESTPIIKGSRKDQIETIATALFKERGFADTSMRDLAREVGIEAASIYSHIKSKEELLQNICFKMANEFFFELENIETQPISFTQKLNQLITAHVKISTQNVAAFTVFQQEWRHLSTPHLDNFLTLREQYQSRIQAIVSQGILEGEFMLTDASFVTRTLLSSLNWIPQWYKLDGPLTPTAIAKNIADLFLNGLIKQKTAGNN